MSSSKTILIAIVVTALLTLGISGLLVNVMERKQEARTPFFHVVE